MILDRYILRSAISPFLTWFVVGMFVFNIQFLWKYIDDLVGKGLEIALIAELLLYYSLAAIPSALLVAVIVSAVMVMGNLAEYYELSSIKSAGVGLLRAMMPLLAGATVVAAVSFFCSDQLIPVASLKFKSRLYDIRKQKPALSLDAGQFNYDFQHYAIYIASKGNDNKSLTGIRFFDHTQHRGNINQTNAAYGEMYYTPDKRYMVMRLFDGERFEEVQGEEKRMKNKPFLRMSFKAYSSLFDLAQFELKETDEDLFKNHYSLLSSRQLLSALDSVDRRRLLRLSHLSANCDPMFHLARTTTEGVAVENRAQLRRYAPAELPRMEIPEDKSTFAQFLPDTLLRGAYSRAQGNSTNIKTFAEAIVKEAEATQQGRVLYENELHRKLVFSFCCLVFLFIGAPLGAIIRKGGFGWPILLAILFFVLFILLSMVGEKLAKNLVLPSFWGMWMPVYVLSLVSLFVTFRALGDANPFDFRSLWSFLVQKAARLKKR